MDVAGRCGGAGGRAGCSSRSADGDGERWSGDDAAPSRGHRHHRCRRSLCQHSSVFARRPTHPPDTHPALGRVDDGGRAIAGHSAAHAPHWGGGVRAAVRRPCRSPWTLDSTPIRWSARRRLHRAWGMPMERPQRHCWPAYRR
eukprot:ctg_368.g272